jgi:hypothetical protein
VAFFGGKKLLSDPVKSLTKPTSKVDKGKKTSKEADDEEKEKYGKGKYSNSGQLRYVDSFCQVMTDLMNFQKFPLPFRPCTRCARGDKKCDAFVMIKRHKLSRAYFYCACNQHTCALPGEDCKEAMVYVPLWHHACSPSSHYINIINYASIITSSEESDLY